MIKKVNSTVEFTLLIYRLYELTHPITCLTMHGLDLFMHHYSTLFLMNKKNETLSVVAIRNVA